MSIGHKSLLFASKTIAFTVLDLMSRKELLERAQGEFRERLRGRVYKSPLPEGLKPPLHQLPPYPSP
jgi:aminobenzoyl-glutamate utilization protein B